MLALCWLLLQISIVRGAGSADVLHCRYDVTDNDNYWYRQKGYPLKVGCRPVPNGQGLEDPTLEALYHLKVPTRGEWFNVLDWANQSTNCAGRPDSTACMSCSMNMPKFALDNRVAPFGVYDGLWLYPEPGATCGMCYKIMMVNGTMTDRCRKAMAPGNGDAFESFPECPGRGSTSYIEGSQEEYGWRAKQYKDEATGLPYIIGINVEWYDLDSPLEYGVSYLTKNKRPDGMGSWPLVVSPIPCPVGDHPMEFTFVTTPNNDLKVRKEESYFKLQVAGQRISLAGVQIRWSDTQPWRDMTRTGTRQDGGYGDSDGHWEVNISPDKVSPDAPAMVRIFCSDGSAPLIQPGLVPRTMNCKWQDPDCVRHLGKVQCPA